MPYKAPKKIERKEALLGTNEKIQATYKRTFSSGVRKLFRLSYKVCQCDVDNKHTRKVCRRNR